MTTIPLSFAYGDRGYEGELDFADHDGSLRVTWMEVGISLLSPKIEENRYPDPREIAKHSPDFKLYPWFGYSVGAFSEFFVGDLTRDFGDVPFLESRIGKAELTLGSSTPLGQYLFDGMRDNDFYPEWENILSVRLYGCSAAHVEHYLLGALNSLRRQHALRLNLVDFSPAELPDEPTEFQPTTPSPAILDLEPLRMFYAAGSAGDSANAFLEYYRVLEYYSVLDVQDQVNDLRWSRDLGSRDFIVRVVELLARDEKAAVLRLVASLADASMTATAAADGLSSHPTAAALGTALYDHRNAVAHGKYDQRTKMVTRSPFAPDEKSARWRSIAEELAWRALQSKGTKDL